MPWRSRGPVARSRRGIPYLRSRCLSSTPPPASRAAVPQAPSAAYVPRPESSPVLGMEDSVACVIDGVVVEEGNVGDVGSEEGLGVGAGLGSGGRLRFRLRFRLRLRFRFRFKLRFRFEFGRRLDVPVHEGGHLGVGGQGPQHAIDVVGNDHVHLSGGEVVGHVAGRRAASVLGDGVVVLAGA
jgi:hypothetical protein